ncbi:MAG: hypothetical protein LIQ31_03285, partial [Planctomycetes bacterium]|nr:hypothetical protein [Planctomycetota bacterium]
LQAEIMKEDKFTGTWKEYIAEQEKILKELDAAKVVAETKKSTLDRTTPLQFQDLVKLFTTSHSQLRDKASMASEMGGYVPYNYSIRPWNEIFPQLGGFPFTTLTSSYMAKTMVYYLTRLQFSSYLDFLSDVGPKISEQPWITHDAGMYHTLCGTLLDEVTVVLERLHDEEYHCTASAKEVYEGFTHYFEESVMKSQIRCKELYSFFYEHYDFFSTAANGLLYVAKSGNEWVSRLGQNVLARDSVPVSPHLIERGVIVFPLVLWGKIIGKVFNIDTWVAEHHIKMEKHVDEKNGPYFQSELGNQERFYGISRDLVKRSNVHTVPLLHTFDFQEAKRFAQA